MTQNLPSDPLHRELALMGFDEDARKAIIEIVLNARIITGGAFGLGAVDLGRFLMRESAVPFPRQSWRVRLKFWLQRKWRQISDGIVTPRVTKLHFKREPRDLWIGVFWDVKDDEKEYYVDGHMWWTIVHFYITIVPMVPLFVEVWFPRRVIR